MRPAPTVAQIGSDVFVSYPACPSSVGIIFGFSRIVDHKDTLTAEITITSEMAGELAWSRVNLVSVQGRRALAKIADEASPEAPWAALIDQACRLVARHLRTTEPATALLPEEPTPEEQCLVPGLIYRGEVNILFADGGSTKSLLALAIAVSGVMGHALSQRWAVAPIKRVLYLDWESDRRAHSRRLWGLCHMMERPPDDAILYRRMTRPLLDQLDTVLADRDRYSADLVIADSLGPASGPEPESGDAAIRTMQALRSLGVTVLTLAHVSKLMADDPRPARPYGSVFVQNLARSSIELRRESQSDDGRVVVNLIHRKVNDGQLASPSALEWRFEPTGAILCSGVEASMEHLNLSAQILDALKDGPKGVTGIAEAVTATPSTVRTTLNRMKARNSVLRIERPEAAYGEKVLWGLVDRMRNREP